MTSSQSIRTVVGIDPGLAGGIAILNNGQATVQPMPVLPNPNGRGNSIDARRVTDLLRQIMAQDPAPPLVVLERQQPMPRQGVTSTFATGLGQGLLLGICCGLGVPVEIVQAQRWQKVMFAGRPRQDSKAASIQRCQELFPSVSLLATPRCKRPHDGMADALMIAEYGRRVCGSGLSVPGVSASTQPGELQAPVDPPCVTAVHASGR